MFPIPASEMVFRTLDGSAKAGIVLEPRSLVILSGEGRTNWTYEIPARQSDLIDGLRNPRSRRISLAFRTTLVGN